MYVATIELKTVTLSISNSCYTSSCWVIEQLVNTVLYVFQDFTVARVLYADALKDA